MSARVSASDLRRTICNVTWTGLLAAGIVSARALAEPAAPPPELRVDLRPVADASGETISHVDVSVTIGAAAEGAPPRLRLPLVSSNVETIATSLGPVRAIDGQGPLPLSLRREGSADTGILYWSPERPVSGAFTISYRALIGNRLAPRGAAPPLELRSEAGAFSGAGSSFLILPEGDTLHRLSVRWDLSALPPGSLAVSSLGEGDASLAIPGPPARLERSYFMAGRIGRYPRPDSAGPFHAAWQGDPPFDAAGLMAWTARLHGRFTQFFRQEDAPRYTVFLRPNPVNPGGGVGLAGSFVATFDGSTDGDDLRLTLSHEMFHTFAPRIVQPEGLESAWFGEGLAVHYQRVLPLRFGMIGPDAFLEDLNATAARYYTSAMQWVPNAEVPARFWEDTRIRTLPYDRGALYFADLDHRLRQASDGRRSLDDLLLAMAARQRQRPMLTNADWEALLAGALGDAGVAHFHAMLAGEPPLPASEAFGPCFRRTTRWLRRYELGFEPKVLVEPRRVVRGLVPGSAAEQAGLRNGDEIVRPVPQDRIQGDQQALLHLDVRRGESVRRISYLPRGEQVEAWQWERVEDGSNDCAI